MSNFVIPVLIVDDEYLIRSLVRNSIDWESLGFQIVGEAEDGETALEMVETLRPRLLIVDINIPFMNGLELSKTIRLRYPHIKIIILTGYEEFQYARQAIQAGVLNYILKPIDPAEFTETLLAARETILLEERNRIVSVQSRVKNEAPDPSQVKERFLRTLLSEDFSEDQQEIFDRFKLFRVDLQPSSLVVCLADIHPPGQAIPLPEAEDFEIFREPDGKIIVLANEDTSTIRVKDKAYYELCKKLLQDAKELGCEITIGISEVVSNLSDLREAYKQAMEAVEQRFYQGGRKIYLYERQEEAPVVPEDLPSIPDRDAFLLLLRSGNKHGTIDTVRSFLHEIAAMCPSRQYSRMACMELVSLINEFLEENSIQLKKFLKNEDDVFALVNRFLTFKALENWLLQLVEEIFLTLDANRKSKTQLVVRKAKTFIERNYAKKFITLERIAESVSVSPSYLSSIFKKELGISVIEFLTEHRLKSAKRIMDENSLTPIMEIAERVGYSDPYYFSKCFRKQYGVSPSAYLRGKTISSNN